MQKTINRRLLRAVIAFSVTLSGAASADYVIVDLGRTNGAGPSGISPLAINNDAVVVGSMISAGGLTHGTSYDGTITELASFIEATAISDAGHIVGWYRDGSGYSHGVILSNGVVSDLGRLGGAVVTDTRAFAVNDSGDVVGYSALTNAQYSVAHAFLYSSGTMIDIGTLGGTGSAASGINNAGIVVGYSSGPGNSTIHPFIYSGGVMSDLGTLGGTIALAWAINDNGQVAGYSNLAGDNTSHGFLYDNGTMTDIGTLSGGDFSYPVAINNNGDIVGYGNKVTGSSVTYPFLYSNGVMVDLNTLLPANSGWVLGAGVKDINDYGQIVGTGTVNGETHGYMLSPGC